MNPGIETWLNRTWLTRGWRSNALLPLAWVYAGLIRWQKIRHQTGVCRSESVRATVIVVGNIVAGGGGKTPLTMAIVEHLQDAGYAVGIVSRGYGRQLRDVREVELDSVPQDVGDEPLMMKRRCEVPVFVARRRAEAAKALLAAYPATQILVCDDGLQHPALARNIEICAMDARGIGNGRLLPAGPLRESWPRAVDLLIHTGQRTMREGFSGKRFLADYAVDASGARSCETFNPKTSMRWRLLPNLKLFLTCWWLKGCHWARPLHCKTMLFLTIGAPPQAMRPCFVRRKMPSSCGPDTPRPWPCPCLSSPNRLFWPRWTRWCTSTANTPTSRADLSSCHGLQIT